jgi:hypothetical protein
MAVGLYFDQDIVCDRFGAASVCCTGAVIEAAYVLRAVASLPGISRCSAKDSLRAKREPTAEVKKGVEAPTWNLLIDRSNHDGCFLIRHV